MSAGDRRRQRIPRAVKVGLLIAGGAIVIAVAAGAVFLYSVDNPGAPKLVSDDRIRVAAVGDSNTYGYGVLFDHCATNSYPAQLESMLGDRYQVLNYGLIGRTLLSSGDQPYTKSGFFKVSQQVEPGVVLIMLGTNDSKPSNWRPAAYRRQLVAFVQTYQRLSSHPRVYLLTPPVAAAHNQYAVDPDIVDQQVTPDVEAAAKTTGATLVDVHAATAKDLSHFKDGVHPDAFGYRVIARAVAAAMASPAAAQP